MSVVGVLLLVTIPAVVLAFMSGAKHREYEIERSHARWLKADIVKVVSADRDRFSQIEVSESCSGNAHVHGTVPSEEDRELLKQRIASLVGIRFSNEVGYGVLTNDERMKLESSLLSRVRAIQPIRQLDSGEDPTTNVPASVIDPDLK